MVDLVLRNTKGTPLTNTELDANFTNLNSGKYEMSSGIPQNAQSASYTLALSDVGKHVSITSGGVTIPSGVFAAGGAVTIYNNSSSNQTITQGSGLTLQWAGQSSSTTGNRTLKLYGICTVLFISSTVAVISGAGLS